MFRDSVLFGEVYDGPDHFFKDSRHDTPNHGHTMSSLNGEAWKIINVNGS